MAPARGRTPVRDALKSSSALKAMVQDGNGALQKRHRRYLSEEVRNVFADSLDLDAALRETLPQENRWDYLLGHNTTTKIIGLEPHSAKQDEISTVIRKKEAARGQLAEHLKPGKGISKWLWVASGDVHFANTEKARRRLDESGILFVGRKVLPKHLA